MRVTAADYYWHLPVDSNGRTLMPDSVLSRSIARALCTQDGKIIDAPFHICFAIFFTSTPFASFSSSHGHGFSY